MLKFMCLSLLGVSDKSFLRLTRFSPFTPSNDKARLALTQWTRSAAQHNVDSLVKVGDYYHGLGHPEEDEATRLQKAANTINLLQSHMSVRWRCGTVGCTRMELGYLR
jgi:hypothetical protein